MPTVALNVFISIDSLVPSGWIKYVVVKVLSKAPDGAVVDVKNMSFALPLNPSSRRHFNVEVEPVLSVYVPAVPESPILAVAGIAAVLAETVTISPSMPRKRLSLAFVLKYWFCVMAAKPPFEALKLIFTSIGMALSPRKVVSGKVFSAALPV